METFVIRVWTPGEPERADRDVLRGMLEHVRNGERHPFGSGRELLEQLAAATAVKPQE